MERNGLTLKFLFCSVILWFYFSHILRTLLIKYGKKYPSIFIFPKERMLYYKYSFFVLIIHIEIVYFISHFFDFPVSRMIIVAICILGQTIFFSAKLQEVDKEIDEDSDEDSDKKND